MSLIDDITEGLRRPLTSEKALTNVVADLMIKVVDSIPTEAVKYKAGQNITISDDGTISATDSTYIAGTGIEINGNTINCTVEAGTDYTLPTASASTLGGIKVGNNLSIAGNGTLSATDTTYSDATTSKSGLMSASDKSKLDGLNNYSLPTATQQSLGGIKVGTNLSITADGTLSASDTNTTYTAGGNIQISEDNVISATDTTYSDATTSKSGLMSASDKSKLNGIAANANNYSLPTASSSQLGGVKVGNNLSISDGVLSATDTTYSDATTSKSGLMSASDKSKLNGLSNYSLPIASTSILGGVMVGDNLSIDASGKLSANFTLPADATFTTITLTDADGSVSIDAAQLRQLLALLTPEA